MKRVHERVNEMKRKANVEKAIRELREEKELQGQGVGISESSRKFGVAEHTRECLAIRAEGKLKSINVLDILDDLFVRRGVPEHIRNENGSEFTDEVVRLWLETLEVKSLYIEPGRPWENGDIESFRDKLREDRIIGGHVFYTIYNATRRWS